MAPPPTAATIRETFFSYFEADLPLESWPSSPLVPIDDRTVPLMHAAMNHFKEAFLADHPGGQGSVYSLKCIRTGDKLADYDGDTSYHSFTEILGIWTGGPGGPRGEPFKRQTIGDLWRLLTEKYNLFGDRIYVTYYGGDEKLCLPPDAESRDIWMHYLPKERILCSNSKANFWNPGGTGPCGPSSGIYYDRVGNRDARSSIAVNDHTCPEIWNLVFVQYNREADGVLRHLQVQHLAAGMDFECITSIFQHSMSHYDTDVFKPILKAIHHCAGNRIRPYSGNVGSDDADGVDLAYRVIADHLRIICVATANDTQIGERGREYFLRIMDRRAIELGHRVLKLSEKYYPELVKKSLQRMAVVIIENEVSKVRAQEIVDSELEIFKNTLAEIAYELHLQYLEAIKNEKTKGQVGTKLENILCSDAVEPSPPTKKFKTRVVNFFGQSTRIIHKDKTTKCSLVALCNALLLGGKITLESNVTEVSEVHLLYLVQRRLLCGNIKMELQRKLERSCFQKQVLDVLPHLSHELYMDIKFDSINGFVDSPQCSLFDYLGVPLFHGWLVDPQDEILASVISTCSFVQHSIDVALYESRQETNKLVVQKKQNDDHEEHASKSSEMDTISRFFRGSQLTAHGLTCLREELNEKEPCVLLWRGALITMTKVEGAIYFVVNDTSFLTRDTGVVWELLREVNLCQTFMDCNFSPIASNVNITILPFTKEDRKREKKQNYKKRHLKVPREREEGGQGMLTWCEGSAKTPQQKLDTQPTNETADAHVEPPVPVVPPSSLSTSNRIYQMRQIEFFDRQTQIIHQDQNGPCSLIAICNVLLLKGDISIETNANNIMQTDLLILLQHFLEKKREDEAWSGLFRTAKTSAKCSANAFEQPRSGRFL